MRAAVGRLVVVVVLATSACKERGGVPLTSTIFVPAGSFRAQTLCGVQFRRACELSYPPPYGRGRHRVLVWLDAFWADADLVKRVDYEVCRASGACAAPSEERDPRLADGTCGYRRIARVPFADAVAYCRWRGARLPTPDEYERMARWTDGRRYAAGREPKGCEQRSSPEGIRNLNLTHQWVSSEGRPIIMEGMYYADTDRYEDAERFQGSLAFRCVRSAYPTPDPGRAIVAADQSERWLRGGPDG